MTGTGENEQTIESLQDGKAAVDGCRRCPLYKNASQGVFGEGPLDAPVMIVGEQPGDQEDLAGRPFVGPAGRMLDEGLAAAGVDRDTVYVTNAVKHFKFTQRGKRRMHSRPNAGEIEACRFWLKLEMERTQPKMVVAMGATAIRGVLGRPATVTSLRGKTTELEDGTLLLVTVHPAFLLRIRDKEDRAAERQRFARDLRRIRKITEAAA